MAITIATVQRALKDAANAQQRRLDGYVAKEDWRNAAECDAYLRGLSFAVEIVLMLRIEED